jgi:NADH-quinone oxidoreductase subunit I
MRGYFYNVYSALRTVLIGMRITLRYCFAKTITVQYPDVAPTLQPRTRGFHWYEIEKCIACDQCAKACPVDCIYIEKTGPRKIDKESGVAKGGAMTRYAIDYSKCMFCALCVPPCPTDCIHMGNLHDLSGYDRESMIVEFTELAQKGLQTPQPLWMRKDRLPEWAARTKQAWVDKGMPARQKMLDALTEQKAPPKPAAKEAPDKEAGEKAPAAKAAAAKAPVAKATAPKSAAKSADENPDASDLSKQAGAE